jgi:hypothetical protein
LDLYRRFELHRCKHLIVVADSLLALDNLVTGRYWSYATVFLKARRDAKQVYNLIGKIASKQTKRNGKSKLCYWDDIAGTEEFKEFAESMRGGFLAQGLLASSLEQFVTARVSRFGLGSAPEQDRAFEREYLLSEVCMSVFCTEVLGYWQEIWERPPAPETPDPLKLLYEKCPEVVTRTLGRSPRRQLKFLYPQRMTESVASRKDGQQRPTPP